MTIRTGRGDLQISVTAFGYGVLDRAGSILTAEECVVLSRAWARAAQAIHQREYGKVTAIAADGGEMLEIGLDYSEEWFDTNGGLPEIETFVSE